MDFRCDLCLFEGDARSEADGPHLLKFCPRCGTAKLATPVTVEDLAKLYGNAYRKNPSGQRFGKGLEALIQVLRRKRSRALIREAGISGRFLDIGCGRGDFLRHLREVGWDVVGTELNAEAVAALRTSGFNIHQGTLDDFDFGAQKPFDLITLFHVLEHVPELSVVLSKLEDLSKTGTVLVIEIPNGTGVGHRLFGAGWFGRDLPFHIYQFDPQALIGRLATAGWCLLRFSQSSWEYGPYFLGQSLANYLLPRRHNALYKWLQAPRQESLLGALLQMPLVGVGVLLYPIWFACLAPFRRADVAQLWFRKVS